MVQVAPELLFPNQILEGPVRRHHEARTHHVLFVDVAAHRAEATMLEDAQELRLERRRDVADLVKQDVIGRVAGQEPRLALSAPVKAPFVWPKSSLSTSVSGRDGKLISKKRSANASMLSAGSPVAPRRGATYGGR